ncbi:MAG TPA: hypothetical protein VLB50_12790, partial [Ignavibacteriaceae bacterium]|nr:hypothetical protein [Ignavibacteriaceae bacterium]
MTKSYTPLDFSFIQSLNFNYYYGISSGGSHPISQSKVWGYLRILIVRRIGKNHSIQSFNQSA